MSNKFTRGIPVIFASLMVTSGLYADSCEMKPNGCKGVSLCHTHPDVDYDGFHFDIGFILEQMRITGTDYGYSTTNFNGVNNVAVMNSPVWDMDWGITVGIGYRLPHDDWAVNVNFDWLRGTGTGTIGGTGGPVNAWSNNLLGAAADLQATTSSNTRFTTNYFDLEVVLGRGSYLSGCFALEPHAGLKVDWIDFTQVSTFNNATANATDTRKSNFWGIGPAVGMDSSWMLMNNVSLFFECTSALLIAESSMTTTTAAGSRNIKVTGRSLDVSPAADMTLGFMYDKDVYCDQQHVRFRIGWDTAVVWNTWTHLIALDETSNTYHTSDNNMFSMTGLLVDFGWDF